ncbi:hypothetical protein PVAP13_6NG269164 [Panicum virgatum]|uniref:Uncharacterized protein n=1 Tax=Panicum virgatum TaxID=38727 RepID=A0A8T0R1U0_PANVG|nr:hypothetical protein PVAP13_6NG269164 [Panicum virgatum]
MAATPSPNRLALTTLWARSPCRRRAPTCNVAFTTHAGPALASAPQDAKPPTTRGNTTRTRTRTQPSPRHRTASVLPYPRPIALAAADKPPLRRHGRSQVAALKRRKPDVVAAATAGAVKKEEVARSPPCQETPDVPPGPAITPPLCSADQPLCRRCRASAHPDQALAQPGAPATPPHRREPGAPGPARA